MTFLAPWLLLGLVAAVIPLVLHLRRSRKKQTLEFSTIQFLDRAFVRAARRARLQELFIMLLRMVVLVLLVVALAQPLLGSASWVSWFGGGSSRLVAIVLDNSGSMRMRDDNGQVAFDLARRQALELLDALDADRGDQVTVILAGYRSDKPSALLGEPTSNFDMLRQRLEELQPTDLGSDVERAVMVAAEQLGVRLAPDGRVESIDGDVSQPRQIVVISDMQRVIDGMVMLPEVEQAVIEMLFLPVTTSGRRANVSIDAVDYASARPVRGMPFTLRARVTNHGETNLRPQVELVVEDQPVAVRDFDLPAGRSRVVNFTYRFDQSGSVGGSIGLVDQQPMTTGDNYLDSDDRRYFALHIAPTMRIATVNGAPSSLPRRDELFFLNLALQVQSAQTQGSPIEVEAYTVAQLRDDVLKDVSVLLLANVASLPEQSLAAVERYVDQGGSLLITMGDRVDAALWNQTSGPQRPNGGLLPGVLEQRDEVQAAPPAMPQTVGWFDAGHPALAGFASGELGDLRAVAVSDHVSVTEITGQILMETSSGRPLLIERDFGQGRVVLWTSSIDTDWTSFPVHPTFLPWLGHWLAHLSQTTSLDADQRFVATGHALTLPMSNARPQLQTPSGDWLLPTETSDGWRFEGLDQAGLYRLDPSAVHESKWDTPAQTDAVSVAVNMPQLESRLRFADREAVTEPLGQAVSWTWVEPDGRRMAVGQAAVTGLWDPLLWLALVVVLVEPWIANRMSSRSRASRDTPVRQDAPGVLSGLRAKVWEARR